MFADLNRFGVIDANIGLKYIIRPAAAIAVVLSNKGFLINQFEFGPVRDNLQVSGDWLLFVGRVCLGMGMGRQEHEYAKKEPNGVSHIGDR